MSSSQTGLYRPLDSMKYLRFEQSITVPVTRLDAILQTGLDRQAAQHTETTAQSVYGLAVSYVRTMDGDLPAA